MVFYLQNNISRSKKRLYRFCWGTHHFNVNKKLEKVPCSFSCLLFWTSDMILYFRHQHCCLNITSKAFVFPQGKGRRHKKMPKLGTLSQPEIFGRTPPPPYGTWDTFYMVDRWPLFLFWAFVFVFTLGKAVFIVTIVNLGWGSHTIQCQPHHFPDKGGHAGFLDIL